VKRRLVTLATILTLAGCMTVKQGQLISESQQDHFVYLDHLHCAILQIGPSNAPKAFTIIDGESSAVAPDGERYGIATEPHEYDLRGDRDARVVYVRDRVYLVDGRGQRITRDWKDGRWEFQFALEDAKGRHSKAMTLELCSFDYNPAIHGPPN
jgi:hypothetical protein